MFITILLIQSILFIIIRKTGVVMLNMGGPSKVADVGPFLEKLFSDSFIMQMGNLNYYFIKLFDEKLNKKK